MLLAPGQRPLRPPRFLPSPTETCWGTRMRWCLRVSLPRSPASERAWEPVQTRSGLGVGFQRGTASRFQWAEQGGPERGGDPEPPCLTPCLVCALGAAGCSQLSCRPGANTIPPGRRQ